MADVSLELLGTQLERLQAEQREIRTTLKDLVAGQTVFGNHLLLIEREMVHVKDLLGHIVNRLTRIEDRIVIIETRVE